MNLHRITATSETLEALQRLKNGVVGIRVVPGHPMHPGCTSCTVEAADGTVVKVFPYECYLEHRFEVFPLQAEIVVAGEKIEHASVDLAAPVAVTLHETEEWLDPSVPTGETLGSNPIMQCQGPPGSTSKSAIAACRYVGGVELRGSNGQSVFLATATSPYSLHVQGRAEDKRFNRHAYLPAA